MNKKLKNIPYKERRRIMQYWRDTDERCERVCIKKQTKKLEKEKQEMCGRDRHDVKGEGE